MKNLILIFSLCFFLFSCFEKEEVAVIPQEPIEKGNIKECKEYTNFINFVMSDSVRTPRSNIEKYLYKKQYVYAFHLGIKEEVFDHASRYVIDSQCNLICDFGQAPEPKNICLDWKDAVFIETTWQDNR